MFVGEGETIGAEGVAGGVGFAVHETEEFVKGAGHVAEGARCVAEGARCVAGGAGCVAEGAGLAASGAGDIVLEAECEMGWYGA